MEIIDDEYSSDSTISYMTNYSNDSLIFNNDDLIILQKPEDIRPKILSITSVLNLNLSSNLNLKNISQKIKSNEYEQNYTNKALILKAKNILINIYPNGKIILSGAKSEKESKKYFYKIAKLFKKCSSKEINKDFKVQNILANYNINFKLNLQTLHKELNSLIDNQIDTCNYVLNNYPMVILYINFNEQKINATFFDTGKIVISGAKKLNEIENIFKKIYPVLNKARL